MTEPKIRASNPLGSARYQLQAAIVACHADAADWATTDWEQIVLLYDMLLQLAPSAPHPAHRSIARRYTVGPEAALAEVDALATTLDRYHLYHATRADLLRTLGPEDDAWQPTDAPSNSRPTPQSRP